MPIAGYDEAKCLARRRLAAKRDGVDAVPVRFLPDLEAAAAGAEVQFAIGELPETHDAEMAAINALLPENAQPLSPYQVFIHYFEAANSSFVADRFMFLDASTLKNIAADAAAGFAFMNSHRTGGLSAPSELPFGKTFAGRYEEFITDDGQIGRRALAGFYMLRGVQPNGSAGPTTDDLDRMIEGGTVFDVSVGLRGGQRICDVCGYELNSYDRASGEYICAHMPGSDRKMEPEQIEAQRARGIPDGKASYSLVDARCGEASAVFDGAVTGAGFRKALGLAAHGDLLPTEILQAQGAYSTLLAYGDFLPYMDEGGPVPTLHPTPDTRHAKPDRPASPAKRGKKMGWKKQLLAVLGQVPDEDEADPGSEEVLISGGGGGGDAPREEPPKQEARRSEPVNPVAAAAFKQVQDELAAMKAERAKEKQLRIQAEATSFADGLIQQGKAFPPERPALLAVYIQAANDDAAVPTEVTFAVDREGNEVKGGRCEALRELFERRPSHAMFREMVGADLPGSVRILPNRLETEMSENPGRKLTPEEHDAMLAMSETGRLVLRERANGGGR